MTTLPLPPAPLPTDVFKLPVSRMPVNWPIATFAVPPPSPAPLPIATPLVLALAAAPSAVAPAPALVNVPTAVALAPVAHPDCRWQQRSRPQRSWPSHHAAY